ncbi:cation channel sperm-associated protein 2-like isoform X2 [Xyrauchen texanus]|uniref:cation channel sperm-associated protein 2-like isoform X2 n=1 Tax=Xyrauchen texanus TaxID=154827 RepID=UPI0022425907|nr:cation channel sperm-associated protein 2-like isoform X2 [Xyrauchen texanus]
MSRLIKVQEIKSSDTGQHEEEKPQQRAQIVRNKVNTFNEQPQEEPKSNPKFCIKDVIDPERYRRLRKEDNHLVRFEINPQRPDIITTEKRRLNRVLNRHAKFPPLKMFAHWILESDLFQNMIVFLIVLNVVVLGIEAEFHDNLDPSLETLHTVLQAMNWGILEVFFLEILLKWLDDFWLFWESKWNIFDFAVTVLPVLPEFLPESSEDAIISQNLLKLLIQFRILRCLKIIFKFREMRLILLAIFSACKATICVIPHLLIIFYIFAAFGVHLFRDYTTSNIQGLHYKEDFKDLPSSFITLFTIFTMDHWRKLLEDTRRVPELNHPVCEFFIIFWLLLAAIMSSNTFVGIVVNSFQVMRNNLSQELHQLEIQRKAEFFKTYAMSRKMSQSKVLKDPQHDKDIEGPSTVHEPETISSDYMQNMNEELHWDQGVDEFILAIEYLEDYETVYWPEECRLKCLELQEKLQLKLEERLQLQNRAVQSLLNLHDF